MAMYVSSPRVACAAVYTPVRVEIDGALASWRAAARGPPRDEGATITAAIVQHTSPEQRVLGLESRKRVTR
jgi:hypothetical protein